MSHLAQEQLLDAAEGTMPDAVAAHLRGCERCQRELVGLKTALAAAAEVDVPEPSPLFWGHLSARVREAMQAEAPARVEWWRTWRVALPAAIAAGLALFVYWQPANQEVTPEGIALADLAIVEELATPDPLAVPIDDSVIDVLSVLAADMDWDVAGEVGLPIRAGTIDRLVFELNEDEREELGRLLREELGTNGV